MKKFLMVLLVVAVALTGAVAFARASEADDALVVSALAKFVLANPDSPVAEKAVLVIAKALGVEDGFLGATSLSKVGVTNLTSLGLSDSDGSPPRRIYLWETESIGHTSGTAAVNIQNLHGEPMFIRPDAIQTYIFGSSSGATSATVKMYFVTSTISSGVYNTAPSTYFLYHQIPTSTKGLLVATSTISAKVYGGKSPEVIELADREYLRVQIICDDPLACQTTSTASTGIGNTSFIDIPYELHSTSTTR